MEKQEDWLFPDAGKQRAHLEEKGLVFAQRYLVFSGATADPRAKALLEHWTQWVRGRRIPANATAQEYAAANAVREFIEQIWLQIEFALNGKNQPPVKS